jgi:hypothetical protein
MDKVVVGLIEKVTVMAKGRATVFAKIDTGAESNSIDEKLAEEIGIIPETEVAHVRSALGRHMRPVAMLDVEIAGKKLNGRFTIADRGSLKYPVLIGRNILKRGFLIDPEK